MEAAGHGYVEGQPTGFAVPEVLYDIWRTPPGDPAARRLEVVCPLDIPQNRFRLLHIAFRFLVCEPQEQASQFAHRAMYTDLHGADVDLQHRRNRLVFEFFVTR